MLVSIHQPETLPWLAFFDKVDQSDLFILLDNVQFEKNYYQNRFKIRDGAGSFQIAALPVKKAPLSSLISDRVVNHEDRVFSSSLNVLTERYRRAPFFETYFKPFREILSGQSNLAQLNTELIKYMTKELGIADRFQLASEIDIGSASGGAEIIFELCRAVGATTYLSGKMGRDYLNLKAFTEHNIRLLFQNYQCAEYPQTLDRNFIPYLSGIDLLFNCGKDALSYIRQGRLPNEER